MKKIVVLLVLCACCGGALCAQGVGLGYNMFWSNTLYAAGEQPETVTQKVYNSSSWRGQAAFLYVDGLFVEANVGVTINAVYDESRNTARANRFERLGTTDLKVALFLKGPWIVYPMLGVEWISPLHAKYLSGPQEGQVEGQMWKDVQQQFNRLWIKAGIGLDIPLGKISLRPQFLAGYRINTYREQQMIGNRQFYEPVYKDIIGYSFEGRLALGYRF